MFTYWEVFRDDHQNARQMQKQVSELRRWDLICLLFSGLSWKRILQTSIEKTTQDIAHSELLHENDDTTETASSRQRCIPPLKSSREMYRYSEGVRQRMSRTITNARREDSSLLRNHKYRRKSCPIQKIGISISDDSKWSCRIIMRLHDRKFLLLPERTG